MLYSFENHLLDTDRRELRRNSEPVAVEPQVFDLLVYLVQSRDHVVSKDELFAAVWGGRVVSESALNTRINAARKAIGDSGERQALIRTVARKGFRFVGDLRQEEPPGTPTTRSVAGTSSPAPALSDRPSIAVLPFSNMSGDAAQDYFTDGITEDIIAALSRVRSLFVIARNSSFTYKGKAVDVRQIGRELGVRYVLEGSIRAAGERIRVTAQLVETETATHLWAEKYDRRLMTNDIFDLQDQLTSSVVGGIAPKLEQAEIDRARRKPTGSLDAYDYLLRGMARFYCWTRDANAEALALFHAGVRLDPDFASAHGMVAWCHILRKANGWATDPTSEIAEAEPAARRAAELGRDDAGALHRAGFALAYVVGDFDAGAALVERSVGLNSNLASAWYHSAWIKLFLGEPETAIEQVAQVMRLSPLDPLMFALQNATAYGHFLAGRHDEASSWAERSLHNKPDFHLALRIAAASHTMAGRRSTAENAMARLRRIDPALRIAHLGWLTPLRRPHDIASYADALRLAGLPE